MVESFGREHATEKSEVEFALRSVSPKPSVLFIGFLFCYCTSSFFRCVCCFSSHDHTGV